MNHVWKKVTLGEVCKTTQGIQIPKSEQINKVRPDYKRYLYISDFKHENNLKYIINNYPDKIVKEKDLIVVNTGASAGNIFRGIDGILSNNLFKVSYDDNVIDPDYIFYFVNSENFKSHQSQIMKGTANPHMGHENFKSTPFSYPIIKEQKRIVAILNEVFAAIDKAKANTEKNLQNAKELFESYLQNVFANQGEGWEEKRLGDVCKYDKIQNSRKDLPYIGLENIESNTGRFLGSKVPQTVKSSTFFFTKEHVLYGRLRPYLNKVLLPDFNGHCSTEIFPIKVNSNLDRRFLYYWLTLSDTVRKIDATSTGARMPRANMYTVIEFEFYLPSLKKQITIINALDKLSEETQKLETIYQQKLNNLEELKKSVLQKAFNGELTEKEVAV